MLDFVVGIGVLGLGMVCLGLIAIFAMIREVLLKKERDEWTRRFERRNRKEFEDRGI